jgi:putative ABC transport system ATP-binding protein
MPLIVLTNVIKKYRVDSFNTTVLNNVSMCIEQGEMLAIVGASGSGKSTLMNIIGLLDKMDAGQYVLQERLVAGFSDDELAMLRNHYIGFVFQQFNLLPRLTALQNVALPLTYRHHLSSEQISKQAYHALERTGMAARAHHRPTQLSGGQQQRVAIARAIVTQPQVILADEPTGALDSTTGKEIMALFHELHHEGRTFVIVTHDEQIAAQCSRRIVLADGQVVQRSE